ncbi:CCT-zeta [Intoshia linei]|uniref:CCT-zeta n=1 Tax=Intoshia linei TaxID=1819745 RepID=A0A177APP8_9BILA|nr:CCT-zeta [Intoshia linei]
MSAISIVNPKAEHARSSIALSVNLSAAKGLQTMLSTNLGPHGTVKMLVSGAGDLKFTKDGSVLLNEMQLTHPTAVLIARSATAQDDVTGDGTTSNVLIIGEVLQKAMISLNEGVHPTIIVNGINAAKKICLQTLDNMRWRSDGKDFSTPFLDRSALINVALTTLKTKLVNNVSNILAQHIVDAVLTVKQPNEPIDLFMIEIMEIMNRVDTDSKYFYNFQLY